MEGNVIHRHYFQHIKFQKIRNIDLNYDGLKDAIVQMLAGEHVVINTEKFQNDMTTFSSKDDVLTLLLTQSECFHIVLTLINLCLHLQYKVHGHLWHTQ